MSYVSVHELLDIGERMAQELTDFIDAGEEGGSDMTTARELLDDWEAIWRRTDRYWQNRVVEMPSEESVIEQL